MLLIGNIERGKKKEKGAIAWEDDGGSVGGGNSGGKRAGGGRSNRCRKTRPCGHRWGGYVPGLGGLLEAGGGRASFTKGGRNWFWGMWVVDHRWWW